MPDEYGIPKTDTGVDLVAKNAENGNLTAIQAKFYDRKIYKKHIDSFLAELNKTYYTDGIIIYSQEDLSTHADSALKNISKQVAQIGLNDLKNSHFDWSTYQMGSTTVKAKEKKQIRDYQQIAIEKSLAHFATNERGKLIMAPGTGKTFTSLKIAEALADQSGQEAFNVLFLVPSIQLLQQTLIGWNNDTEKSMYSFAVTSDRNASKVKGDEEMSAKDIGFPATTDASKLMENYRSISENPRQLTVVFSTYQSIEVLQEAQKQGFPTFDLIIADEAHRTTGAKALGEEASVFTKVHRDFIVSAKRRLYQTATPKLYGPDAKAKAQENSIEISSMDDETLYGEEIFRLGFGEAVSKDILTDYKVMVLAVDESVIQKDMQKVLADPQNGLNLDDVSKLIGVWNGLMHRRDARDNYRKHKKNRFEFSFPPMQRAISFIDTINNSKKISEQFNEVVNEYLSDSEGVEQNINVRHVDGKMNALQKKEALDWLSRDFPKNETRVLSNVKFLTEGIDVPNLDAVIFLAPKKSQVDIVQAVGRIMRKFKGKDYGYIILPIVIPTGTTPESVLDNNKKYEAVWQILNALRSVDERFSATINKLELNKKKPENINVVGVGSAPSDEDGTSIAEVASTYAVQGQLQLEWEEVENAIYGKIVKKVGDRRYLDDWSEDVAKIASRHIEQMKILIKENSEAKKSFRAFVKSLKHNINSNIDEKQAIEMLSQHMITKPIFEALFSEYSFVNQNPVSHSMEDILERLSEFGGFQKEQKELESFYESVRLRAEGIDNAEAKQKIIVTLYDKFFSTGFKSTTERLGIVFTPLEVVDFIVHSVDDVLKKYFGKNLASAGVHILDPFTGTGTFIVRTLHYLKEQMDKGEITLADITRKYTQELHANEIVLLSYYIAAINIESTFDDLNGDEAGYLPFEGIVLTDTFESTEKEDTLDDGYFGGNDERLKRQQEVPITVIMGNPPYSARQTSANDDNESKKYPFLDEQIKERYGKFSESINKNALYDSYVRAFRWSSDRLKDNGIIAFVNPNSIVDKAIMRGFRKSLLEEFNHVFVFDLRGAVRGRVGEEARKEGQSIFNILTGVCITLLIKDGTKNHEILYADIGEYLSRDSKLDIISSYKSINSIDWHVIESDQNNDWINKRDEIYESFLPMIQTEQDELSIFQDKSIGITTGRDDWVCGFSEENVRLNVDKMILNFNSEVDRLAYMEGYQDKKKSLNKEETFIKWSGALTSRFLSGKKIRDADMIELTMYRPFTVKYLSYDKQFIERPRKYKEVMGKTNQLIYISGAGARREFSAIITKYVPNAHLIDSGQGFYLYNNSKPIGEQQNISTETQKKLVLNSEETFYYVYGVLHSKYYKKNYDNDLRKGTPRIPLLKNKEKYVQIGRQLADLHLNYEHQPSWQGAIVTGEESQNFRVKKMKHPKKGKLDTIIFNENITISNIPEEAYEYIVNGRSAIGWIMDQYQVKTDKKSGITDDPNEFAPENPRYILDLLLSIITVSMRTVELVNELPPMEVVE